MIDGKSLASFKIEDNGKLIEGEHKHEKLYGKIGGQYIFGNKVLRYYNYPEYNESVISLIL